jgi:hypothetical protein
MLQIIATCRISSQKFIAPPQPALPPAIRVNHCTAAVPPTTLVLSFVNRPIRPQVFASSVLLVVLPLTSSHVSIGVGANTCPLALVVVLSHVPFIRPCFAVDDKTLQLQGGRGITRVWVQFSKCLTWFWIGLKPKGVEVG